MIRRDRKDAAQKFCLSSVELKKKKLFPFENIKHDRHEQRKGLYSTRQYIPLKYQNVLDITMISRLTKNKCKM